MSALFLYNENVPLSLKDSFVDSLGSVSSFKILKDEMLTPSFSVDRKISEYLLGQEIEQKRYRVIFISYSLSEENYMEFLGLRMAYHIRLTKEFNNIQTPIVFYGLESEWEINKLTNLGQILFTSNIYPTQKISVDDFQKMINYIQGLPSSEELSDELFIKKFISKTTLNPPGNYQSHHSIDNELALLRWSIYLGCDHKIPEVKNNLKTGLYFKYYNALNPIEKPKKGAPFLIPGKSKVLLIDDEFDKGWYTFYNSFFQMSSSITFEALNVDYKGLAQNEIIEKAIAKINDFDADVVLLDLRLCDIDFSKGIKPEYLTGSQILNRIKQKINKGIQVIITTASNKVWSYKSIMTEGADGYIVKRGDSYVADDLRNLRNTIINAISKAPFLKKAHVLIANIESKIQLNTRFDSNDDTLRKNLNINYDISFEMMQQGFLNSKYFNYCYLQLFLCIEEFLKIATIFDFGDKCYLNTNIKVAVKEEKTWRSIIKYNKENPSYWSIQENTDVTNISSDFKMSSVLIFLFNQMNSNCLNWSKIRDIRNKKAGHPERSAVTRNEILEILEFQEYIFNNENFQTPCKEGLSESISADDIQKLKDKLGSK